MPALSDYTNVYNTALNVLKRKGYQLWYDAETDLYGAEKGGWDFLADSPSALLGMVAIYESAAPKEYAEYWWRNNAERLYGNLPARPNDYTSVIQRRV